MANPVVRYHEICRENVSRNTRWLVFSFGNRLSRVKVEGRGRNLENHENHGLGPVQSPFGGTIGVGVVLRTMFLRQMACRDSLVLEKAVQAILFYRPGQIAKFKGR